MKFLHSAKSKKLAAVSTVIVIAILVVIWLSTSSKQPDVILVVWQTETDKAAIDSLKKTIAEFEESNPHVKVQLESIAWNSLLDKLESSLTGHTEPDVTHLEPFMAFSLINRNLLLPLDDVVDAIEAENKDKILESVRDLWLHDGKRYGIAHAVGTTGFAYRKDWAKRLNLQEPKTWKEYVDFAKQMSERTDGKLKTLLPGGDRFFIDQLFAELLANNGGKLFDPATNRPLLNEKAVWETLEFFQQLGPYVDPAWTNQKYLDQFHRFARGEAGNIPVTYARATKAIETAFNTRSAINESAKPDPEHFALMPQPVGPSHSGPSIATIDCEPFVIFKSSQQRAAPEPYGNKAELGKKFLRLYYRKDRYLDFARQVPIHLTPVFNDMAISPEYTSSDTIQKWKPWADQNRMFLGDPARVRPILMPDVSPAGRQLPFLLELHKEKILTQAVTDVLVNGIVPKEAARIAQEKAEKLVQRLTPGNHKR